MRITDLPDDILLHIVLYLRIQDVLSFKQASHPSHALLSIHAHILAKTCRVLHAFGSTDYLWHRLAHSSNLLLNIPAHASVSELPADELQRLAIDAIQLQVNWARNPPHIRRTICFDTSKDGSYDHLQLFQGGRWLFVAQGRHHHFEARFHSTVSLWSLHDWDHLHCVVKYDLTGMHRASDVVFDAEEETATIAVALHSADCE